MPALWALRFGDNPELLGTEAPKDFADISWATTLRRSCDYRIPVGLLEAHLKQLKFELTQKQSNALTRFKEVYRQYCDARKGEGDYPEASALCKPPDILFFGGCLVNLKYVWEPEEGSPGEHYGQRGCVPSTIFLNQDELEKSRHTDSIVICTILHEMLRECLYRFCCNRKDCTYTSVYSSQELCRYMHARCIDLYTSATYVDDQGVPETETSKYSGHGPIFQRLMTVIQKDAPFILGRRFAFKLGNAPGERPCKCKGQLSGCLSHCCASHRDMQRHVLERIKAGD